ncbi:type II toxin-antitoxin system HipA family toxin [Streptomyces sp. NPDC090106]|uniref:type II toxin-antitoxin system HipA family toxin n=1 Tax=Streptomyces sp. NPDC090106 TaxID=3365946 RepID=UPI003830C690
MAPQTTRARVLLGSRQVGTLSFQNGRSAFQYEDLDPDHPILGLAFEYDPEVASSQVTGVPSWFANLLPERGSALRRIYNQRLRREAHDFLLLIYLGHDLPGAVVVEADGELPQNMSEALEEAHTATQTETLGFSLSGMQLKFSMQEDGTAFRLPPHKGELGDWIVKLPSTVLPDLPANEHLVMSWAKSIGIDVPEHRLVPLTAITGVEEDYLEGGTTAFAIRRFDRTPDGGRVHQEDFTQVFDVLPADKDRGQHEAIARVLLENCPQDLDEYVRRIVLCIAAGNNDEHLKNWSLRYADGHTTRLSPAYDMLSATAYSAFRRQGLTLSIGEQKDMRWITRDHFRRFAEAVDTDPAPVLAVVDEAVANLHHTLPTVADTVGAPEFVIDHLRDRLNGLPLMRGT